MDKNIFQDMEKYDFAKLVPNIFQVLEDVKGKVQNNNQDFQDWLKFAKQDLDASVILYEKEDFRNSIYLLQQSVEKACKYYGLSYGLISQKDLHKDVSHVSPKIFKIFINQSSVDLVKNLGGKEIKVDEFEKALKNKKEMINISEKFIEICFNMSFQLETNFNKIKLLDKKIINFSILNVNLYSLSMITYAHINCRYPDETIVYNKETPIVKKYNDIVKVLKKVIGELEKNE